MSRPAAKEPQAYLPRVAASEDWTTPPDVCGVVERAFGTRIDLDPCANPSSIVPADRQVWLPKWKDWYLEDRAHLPEGVEVADGLEVPWEGNVFINPPYASKPMGAFMAKAARLAAEDRGSAIVLIPSKTDIKVWHQHVRSAASLFFFEGRLTFGGAEAGAPFPSALVLWTRDRKLQHRFAIHLDDLGQVWRPA